MINKLKKLLYDDKGQALVLVAITLTVLLGFAALAIDYGYLSHQKRKLQNAADAAALAGVQELSENKNDTVHEMAKEYAIENVSELIDGEVISLVQNDNKEVKVTVSNNYDTFFGKVLGINNKVITASAIATWEAENNYEDISKKLLPIAVTEREISKYFFGGKKEIGDPIEKESYYVGVINTPKSAINRFPIVGYREGENGKKYTDEQIGTWLSGQNISEYLNIKIDENLFMHDVIETKTITESIGKRIKYAKPLPPQKRKEIMTAYIPVIEKNNSGKVTFIAKIIIWDVITKGSINNTGQGYVLGRDFEQDNDIIGEFKWYYAANKGYFRNLRGINDAGSIVVSIEEIRADLDFENQIGKKIYKLIK